MDKSILKEYNKVREIKDSSIISYDPTATICYAPRKNMYFDALGYVYSCCYNRGKPIGEYPRMTLNEIWNGELAKELRKDIDNFEFNKWCGFCKYDLENKNYEGFKGKYWDYISLNNNWPTRIEFELTNKCNLECVMCNGGWSHLIRKNREKLDPIKMVYDEKFIEQLEEFIPQLEQALFIGGEPFAINIYYDIWEKMVELNNKCNIIIQTNGTILNNRIKKLLDNGKFTINISLDSLNEKNYNAIRVNADFNVVMKNLEYYMEYCKKRGTSLNITPTIIKQNCLELENFVNFANEREIGVYFHTAESPKEYSVRNNSLNELKKIYDIISSFKFTENTWQEKDNKKNAKSIIYKIYLWMRELNEKT
jgi:MoaA/NifB/PqqE/SkfB family radical SAM enzyme